MKKLILILIVFLVPVGLYEGGKIIIEEIRTVSVLNFGDVMFDRGVRNIIENRDRDPFEYIKKDKSILKKYDVVVANLEGPIIEMNRSLCQQKAYNFQFAVNTTEMLKSVGINMVSIANNHSYDCFSGGFTSTKKYLKESGIDFIGDRPVENSFVVKEINGRRVAFVGMDETVMMIPLSLYYPLIKKLKAENDFVVVNIHWGREYELVESGGQRTIAHKLIDNGADVIFGHHPHVVQPVEIYNGGVVFYSLGNFVFDQNFGDTTIGLGAGVEFAGGKKIFEIFPFNIKKFAPDFMLGEERSSYCDKFLKNIAHQGCKFEL